MKKLVFLFAMVFAVSMAMGQNNTSSTDIDGNNNVTTVNQVGIENSGDISVDGNQNDALIQQGNFGGGLVQSNYAEASIEQIGNKNYAEVKQRQGWAGATAVSVHSITQEGNQNEAWLETFNGGNSGMIYQEGNKNWAKGRQSVGAGNNVEITQEGNSNWAFVNQLNSADNSASVSQDGNDNWTSVDQSGGHDNTYIENTTGNGNNVTAFQNTSWAKLDLTIEGNSNTVFSTQDHNDKAYIDIFGNNNDFYLEQGYHANHVGASITGNSNDIDVVQTGAGNHVTSDLSVNAFAKDGIIISGNSNVVDILQETDYNQANVSIIGANNQSYVTQQ